MKTLILAAALLFASQAAQCAESDPWTQQDTYRQAAVLTALAVDAGQTLDIARHKGMYEHNALLGLHPSRQWVEAYFLGAAIAHTYIASVLPASQRKLLQEGTLALELVVIGHNKSIGLNVRY